MVEIRHLENRHVVIFFCWEWSDLHKISESGAEWHVDCGDVVETETICKIPICVVCANSVACHPRATCHIAGCCHLANSMTCHRRATCHFAGCCHLVNSLSRFQSHMPHCRVQSPGEINDMSWQNHVSLCRVLPLGEFTVTIPESHATLQGAVTWRNQWHDRATLQGVRIPSAILKIVFRHILLFFNALEALTSGGFRIVSDTLVT